MEQRAEAQSIPSADIIFHTKEIFVAMISYKSCGIEGVIFSLRSMKRSDGVFSPKAKKWYVHKFHASQRNILQ
jgi:hypothetical protein